MRQVTTVDGEAMDNWLERGPTCVVCYRTADCLHRIDMRWVMTAALGPTDEPVREPICMKCLAHVPRCDMCYRPMRRWLALKRHPSVTTWHRRCWTCGEPDWWASLPAPLTPTRVPQPQCLAPSAPIEPPTPEDLDMTDRAYARYEETRDDPYYIPEHHRRDDPSFQDLC